MRRLVPLALCSLLACGGTDTTSPANRVPALGRYSFTAAHPGSGRAFTAESYSGTLTLSAADEARIVGTVAAAGLAPAIEGGTWATDSFGAAAYQLKIRSTTGAPSLNLSITRGAGGALSCGGLVALIAGDTGGSAPVTCAVAYVGP